MFLTVHPRNTSVPKVFRGPFGVCQDSQLPLGSFLPHPPSVTVLPHHQWSVLRPPTFWDRNRNESKPRRYKYYLYPLTLKGTGPSWGSRSVPKLRDDSRVDSLLVLLQYPTEEVFRNDDYEASGCGARLTRSSGGYRGLPDPR